MPPICAESPEGPPARCLACGRVFRIRYDVCPHCSSPDVAPLIFLSTTTALASFLCVLAWEFEAFVAGLHLLAGKKVNLAGHIILLVASTALTLFACLKGRRELATARALGARSAITSGQAIMIVLILLVSSALVAAFLDWQLR